MEIVGRIWNGIVLIFYGGSIPFSTMSFQLAIYDNSDSGLKENTIKLKCYGLKQTTKAALLNVKCRSKQMHKLYKMLYSNMLVTIYDHDCD